MTRNTIIMGNIIFILLSFNAYADYCATGAIEGEVCTGLAIKSCAFYQLDGIKDRDGKLHAVSSCYPNVSSYDEGKGRCWLRNNLRGVEFYHRNTKGQYEKLGTVESVTFPCIKQ